MKSIPKKERQLAIQSCVLLARYRTFRRKAPSSPLVSRACKSLFIRSFQEARNAQRLVRWATSRSDLDCIGARATPRKLYWFEKRIWIVFGLFDSRRSPKTPLSFAKPWANPKLSLWTEIPKHANFHKLTFSFPVLLLPQLSMASGAACRTCREAGGRARAHSFVASDFIESSLGVCACWAASVDSFAEICAWGTLELISVAIGPESLYADPRRTGRVGRGYLH